MQLTRYEKIAARHSRQPGDLASQFAAASRAARTLTSVTSAHEMAIRDVAAGVAAPALIGCVIWMLNEARARNLVRLRFLSRDGQVMFELARRIAARQHIDIDIDYVYSSRITWSLAATDPERLPSAQWLFNSFMKSNAADVCARLGLPLTDYLPALQAAGVSLDPGQRADQQGQLRALRRFVDSPDVARAAADRITAMRRLLLGYAALHDLADPATALVDAGWTGRMVGSLVGVCAAAGMSRPHILLWGHEPRATGWTDSERVAAYLYNTARGEGLDWRVPDAPFIVETFCMGDHGILSGYRYASSGEVEPVLSAQANSSAEAWGLDLYRSTLYKVCDALEGNLDGDLRPLIHAVMDAFWCHPSSSEARAWGAYPYDSDPAGTAVRQLARPFTARHAAIATDGHLPRGDRAWLAGSVALSSPDLRKQYTAQLTESDRTGAPATD